MNELNKFWEWMTAGGVYALEIDGFKQEINNYKNKIKEL